MSNAIVPLMGIESAMSKPLKAGADDGRKIENGMVMGMIECRRCKKPIHHNYFPKLALEIKETVLFSHNVYNYLEDRYVLCTRCKKEFYRFIEGERKDNA